MRRRTAKARHAEHGAFAARFEGTLRIRKSLIAKAGGGAFAGMDVPRGALLGFYQGKRVSCKESGQPGFCRDYVRAAR